MSSISQKPVVRFAPSPTGYLHIGGVRTALFNWLFAKHHQGSYHLRIEDTDRERSTPEAVNAILDSLKWLGLDHDGEIIYQSTRFNRHYEVAQQMVEKGTAYYCTCSPEEVDAMREKAKSEGRSPKYDGTCRDKNLKSDQAPHAVIRLKCPQDGETIINDHVQGTVTVKNKTLDDLILVRSDKTPTYMLSVVVDDHDMGITHIIRGDDHLTNGFKQVQIYKNMGWSIPEFAHIPLIHGPDGAKLSKRHGAVGVEWYKQEGYLPEALLNYLLRLGWSHGDEEMISISQAIEWFNLESIGQSPSRLDFAKLNNVNAHYIKISDNQRLIQLVSQFFKDHYSHLEISEQELKWIEDGMNGLKERSKTLKELTESALIYTRHIFEYDEKARKFITEDTFTTIKDLVSTLEKIEFNHDSLNQIVRQFAEERSLKMSNLSQCIRVALTHRTVSPSIFDIMEVLGKSESLERLKSFCNTPL
ncbi:MAG: glutamate--tRNA ligase [Candidatus Puniceispirillum sp.]|nr:glutamate--tRNA ligase [Candidatus Pelagibacter sp.]MBA4282765.1 glutamate--tRNA ligase [Candidatus Puniceispirillum sp.]